MTHVEKMYHYFKQHEGLEVNHRVFIADMYISEYTGRITDLRRKFGCTCGENQRLCSASEHVRNTRKNFYMYVNEKIERVKKFEIQSQPMKISITDELVAVINHLETEKDDFKRKLLEKKKEILIKMQHDEIGTVQKYLF